MRVAGNEEPGRAGWSSTARSKVVRALLDGGELADGVDHHVVHARGEAGVGEGYDDGSHQHRLEMLRGGGPQAGALDDLAQLTAACVHRLHRCFWLLVTWSWIGVSSVAQRLRSRWIGVVGRLYMRIQTLLHSHRDGSIMPLQLISSACN